MKNEKSLKDEVQLALLTLHKKIDSLKEQVDRLCQSTEECSTLDEKPIQNNKKRK